ncbi:MAG: dolichyl-phosphate beta-glucosyltransferase [Candidatus Omnitrophota bacterium]
MANDYNNIYLSILIPAYNEEQNISSTLQDIYKYLATKDFTYEILVVDDGSTDKTVELVSPFRNKFQNIEVLKNDKNFGKGYSIKKGMLTAKGELILFMDADNATRIHELDKFLPKAKEGNDVIIASRRIPGAEITSSQPICRIILGNIYILLSKIILGASVNDYNCGFKLYTSKSAKLLFPKLTRNDWSFDSELIYLIKKFKLKLKEVPVKWEDKRTSKVKPFKDGIKSLVSLIIIRIQAIRKMYD